MFRQFQKRLNLCFDTNLCWYHIPSSPRLTYTYALIPLNCDAPNPAPDGGMSSGGVTLRDCDYLTFSFSELTLAFIRTISVITKILFTYTLYIPPSWHSLYSIHLYLIPFTCTITISLLHIKSEIAEQCGEHLSLRWPVLLMWNVLSSILVFCFCTYTD